MYRDVKITLAHDQICVLNGPLKDESLVSLVTGPAVAYVAAELKDTQTFAAWIFLFQPLL